MQNVTTGAISDRQPVAKLKIKKRTLLKKIICIGECALDIVFSDGQPIGSIPGGRIVNAAAILSRQGMPVIMASEAAADPVGDIITDFLSQAGTDIGTIDRFTEGRTPILIYTQADDGSATITRYEDYSEECFDIVWPRVDEGDIILFGGFYAIDPRMRTRMTQLLHHCSERKAVLTYLPGFLPQQEPRITRVMPAILENLELADIVITRIGDLRLIFGADNGESCYHDHIDFYCRSLINVDTERNRIDYHSCKDTTSAEIPARECKSMMWNAGAVAGTVAALYTDALTSEKLDNPDEATRRKILASAIETAHKAYKGLAYEWQKSH